MSTVLSDLARNTQYVTRKQYANNCVRRWSKTPLLKGLEGPKKAQVAMILENQMRHTLTENNALTTGANSLADAGNIRGYTAIAFPLVRRVFGNIIANNIASIQTMNAPTGLVFYLDFIYSRDAGGDVDADGTAPEADYDVSTYASGKSLYGNPAGADVRKGATRVGGQFDLTGHNYSRWHEPAQLPNGALLLAGAFNDGTDPGSVLEDGSVAFTTGKDVETLQFDSQILDLMDDGTEFFFLLVDLQAQAGGEPLFARADLTAFRDFSLFHRVDGTTGSRFATGALPIPEDLVQGSKGLVNVRRLNQIGRVVRDGGGTIVGFQRDPFVTTATTDAAALFVVHGRPVDDPAATSPTVGVEAFWDGTTDPTALSVFGMSYVIGNAFQTAEDGSTLLKPAGESNLAVDPRPLISEITMKLGTLNVNVQKRAYRMKWTDELETDVRAQLAIDVAETLSNVMSDQMTLDVDRELLADMLDKAAAANFFWSKQVGKYINYRTGRPVTYDISDDEAIPSAASAVARRDEWYSGLVEVMVHASNEIHTRTLRGQANFAVVSPDVAAILESTRMFRSTYSLDSNGQIDINSYSVGAEQVGTIEGRFKVYRCPDFPRNKILLGYKGNDDLDTGYIYAPYVPLIITPVLHNTEDFQPRQAMFTRYAKRMIRADYFATVTVLDINTV